MWEKISGGMQDQPVTIFLFVVGIAVIVLAVFAVRAFLREMDRRSPETKALFNKLCRDNGLNGTEVRVLKKLAQAYDIPDPVMLFLRRSLFESGAAKGNLDTAVAEQLRKKLYGA